MPIAISLKTTSIPDVVLFSNGPLFKVYNVFHEDITSLGQFGTYKVSTSTKNSNCLSSFINSDNIVFWESQLFSESTIGYIVPNFYCQQEINYSVHPINSFNSTSFVKNLSSGQGILSKRYPVNSGVTVSFYPIKMFTNGMPGMTEAGVKFSSTALTRYNNFFNIFNECFVTGFNEKLVDSVSVDSNYFIFVFPNTAHGFSETNVIKFGNSVGVTFGDGLTNQSEFLVVNVSGNIVKCEKSIETGISYTGGGAVTVKIAPVGYTLPFSSSGSSKFIIASKDFAGYTKNYFRFDMATASATYHKGFKLKVSKIADDIDMLTANSTTYGSSYCDTYLSSSATENQITPFRIIAGPTGFWLFGDHNTSSVSTAYYFGSPRTSTISQKVNTCIAYRSISYSNSTSACYASPLSDNTSYIAIDSNTNSDGSPYTGKPLFTVPGINVGGAETWDTSYSYSYYPATDSSNTKLSFTDPVLTDRTGLVGSIPGTLIPNWLTSGNHGSYKEDEQGNRFIMLFNRHNYSMKSVWAYSLTLNYWV